MPLGIYQRKLTSTLAYKKTLASPALFQKLAGQIECKLEQGAALRNFARHWREKNITEGNFRVRKLACILSLAYRNNIINKMIGKNKAYDLK